MERKASLLWIYRVDHFVRGIILAVSGIPVVSDIWVIYVIVGVDSTLHKVASDAKAEGGGWLGH